MLIGGVSECWLVSMEKCNHPRRVHPSSTVLAETIAQTIVGCIGNTLENQNSRRTEKNRQQQHPIHSRLGDAHQP
jgi:hypothetical protein